MWDASTLLHGSGLLSGPITVGQITFFNTNFVQGTIASANYSIYISTTSAAVNGLSAMFADNLGADNQLFFSGALGGPIDPSGQFTLTGASFNYDPSGGNLLLTVSKDAGEFDFSVFLDYTSNAPAGTFSRAYSFGSSGVADALENDTGLVTKFSTPAPPNPVPEPGSLWLMGIGLFALLIRLNLTRMSTC